MEKSGDLKDRRKLEIVSREIQGFEKLIKGHARLLTAIGNL